MDELIGQGQIRQSIFVDSRVEIIIVAGEGFSEAMVEVEHGSNAIEAEAIELIVLNPIVAVGKQKVQHGRLGVVKTTAVPCGMLTTGSFVKILVERAIKTGNAIALVLHAVGVDEINDHGQPEAMGGIDEFLEFLRSAKPRAGGEKATHMIAEGTVVGMLQNPHDLHRIITTGDDTGQDAVLEFQIGPYFGLFLGHADVGFVDQQGTLAGKWTGVFPNVRRNVPDLGGENK